MTLTIYIFLSTHRRTSSELEKKVLIVPGFINNLFSLTYFVKTCRTITVYRNKNFHSTSIKQDRNYTKELKISKFIITLTN